MRKIVSLGLLLILSWAAPGCGLTPPRLRQPGYIYQQQLRATFYDPYGSVDMAPDVMGGRPHSFGQPRTQETQTQWALDQP